MNFKRTLLSIAAAGGLFIFGSKAANADQVTYMVKSGDTVAQIANAHHTTVTSIDKLNNLSDINVIYVGQQLKIDENGTATTTTTNTAAQTTQTAQQTQTQQTQQPVQQTQQVQQPVQKQTASTQNTTSTQSTASTGVSGSEASAKAWIAGRESGGSYSASNGQYVGKYQLSKSYLNGDYSAANQERVANQSVHSLYGSWTAAKAHWEENGWY